MKLTKVTTFKNRIVRVEDIRECQDIYTYILEQPGYVNIMFEECELKYIHYYIKTHDFIKAFIHVKQFLRIEEDDNK